MTEIEGLECWTCTIYGDPVAKGRPRFGRRGSKVISYTPARTQVFEAEAAALFVESWGDRPPLSQPCELTVVSVFKRPERLRCKHKRPCECNPRRLPHVSRPDLDNCVKAVCDALQRFTPDGRSVLVDDSRICSVHAVKVYAKDDPKDKPRTEIRLCWGPAVEALR
jgi:Holliday junction resolvase RusA-like endonuclease